MPVYQYQAAGEGGCEQCREGFATRQQLGAAPLTKCPLCGGPVKRVVTGFSVARGKSAFYQRASDLGFKTLRKQSDGSYRQD